jgi:hypothetical protein
MKTALALILCALLLAGCGKKETAKNPLAAQDTMAISIAKGEFDGYIKAWETRVADGSWDRMVADGSWVKLVPESHRGTDPAKFPAIRIAELKEARDKMAAELRRRAKE